MITVALVNASTVVSDAALAPILAALQIQVTRDAGPIWDLGPITLVQVDKGGIAAPGSWQLIILDDSDQADALGYHDWTAGGLPIGKVFAKSDLQAGSSLSVTISHELLEMLVDPWICYTVQTGSSFLALEVGDPCEDDSFGYKIGDVLVSDFVTPAWFDGSTAPYDYGKHVTSAGQILLNGYIGQWTPQAGWQQITSGQQPTPSARFRAPIGSRRERRRTPRSQWQRSTV